MIPRTLLVAACAFDERLSAQRVVSAISRGLRKGGWPTDLCAIAPEGKPGQTMGELLDDLDFDLRMRAARALILAERRLAEDMLAGSVAFEVATRARQAGVPAYAVTGANELDAFDARILDLQGILQAPSAAAALERAGTELANLI
jgi:glycerate kinase